MMAVEIIVNVFNWPKMQVGPAIPHQITFFLTSLSKH